MEKAFSTPMAIGVDAYQDWVDAEGIPVHEGMALNVRNLDTAYWPRFGINGAVVHFAGRGDFCSRFLYDIAAGQSSTPVRHLYEAIYFVVEGRGSTQLRFDDGRTHQFEWGPRIHALWLEEMRKNGITPRFQLPVAVG